MKKIKGLIVGCGSIGERHLYNLKKLGIKKIAICDKSTKRLEKLSKKYKTKIFHNFHSSLSFEPNFTIISTYPSTHIQIANECINANSHVFIEKPISNTINGVKQMLKKADSKNLKVSVGYNLRFDKGTNLLKSNLYKNKIGTPLSIHSEWGQHIKFWHPNTNYKNHYVLRKDGGIILDDSHEYDLLRWLLDDEPCSVYCQTKYSNSIKTHTESIASILIKFRKGTIASLVIDYLRPKYERKCQIIGEKGALTWNFIPMKKFSSNYSSRVNSQVILNSLRKTDIIRNNNDFLNSMYLNEMKNFINSILFGEKLVVDGWDSYRTLKLGITAKKSARTNKVINL